MYNRNIKKQKHKMLSISMKNFNKIHFVLFLLGSGFLTSWFPHILHMIPQDPTYDPVCEIFSYISINHCINRELSVANVVYDLFKIHTLYASKIEM